MQQKDKKYPSALDYRRATNTLAAAQDESPVASPFIIPRPAPGVVPKGTVLAMDSVSATYSELSLLDQFSEGQIFLGFPYLAQLSQRVEYRNFAEIHSGEMTREWIKFSTVSEESDKNDRIKAIEDKLKDLKLKDRIRDALSHDATFGHGFIGIEDNHNGDRKVPLLAREGLKLDKLIVIEAPWTYPGNFNSLNPFSSDFYKPDTWWVMGEEIHDSRFLHLRSNPLPQILRPAYSFAGLSMSQLCKPYVDNWLNARQAVAEILKSFSVLGLQMDLSQMLQNQGQANIKARVDFFNAARNNKGLALLDKDSEEFFQMITPLTGLDKLKDQFQGDMASAARIPLVKLLGITPSGLNASSDGEIKVFYDTVADKQELVLRPTITRIVDLVQHELFGGIDPDIKFDFVSLWQESKTEATARFLQNAQALATLVGGPIINQVEARKALANDPDNPLNGIQADDLDGLFDDEDLNDGKEDDPKTESDKT